MRNYNDIINDVSKIQNDIENILIDGLRAPKFSLDDLKDKTDFLEPNPRLVYEAEQKRLEDIQLEEENQKRIALEEEQKKIQNEEKLRVQRAEEERKAKIDNFWGSVAIFLLVAGIVFIGLLISSLAKS